MQGNNLYMELVTCLLWLGIVECYKPEARCKKSLATFCCSLSSGNGRGHGALYNPRLCVMIGSHSTGYIPIAFASSSILPVHGRYPD